eukprot:1005157-Prymnesium_polylepis.2
MSLAVGVARSTAAAGAWRGGSGVTMMSRRFKATAATAMARCSASGAPTVGAGDVRGQTSAAALHGRWGGRTAITPGEESGRPGALTCSLCPHPTPPPPRTHAHTHARKHAQRSRQTHTASAHARARAHAHARARTRTCTLTHAHVHAHTRARALAAAPESCASGTRMVASVNCNPDRMAAARASAVSTCNSASCKAPRARAHQPFCLLKLARRARRLLLRLFECGRLSGPARGSRLPRARRLRRVACGQRLGLSQSLLEKVALQVIPAALGRRWEASSHGAKRQSIWRQR